VRAVDAIDRWTFGVIAALLGVSSLGLTLTLNFRNYTDDREPYVYVQTFTDVNQFLDPLRTLARRNPLHYHLRGHLILPEQYPWVWLLADFPRVDYPSFDQLPEPLDADFLIVDDPLVEQVEPLLRLDYYKFSIRLRGNSDNRATVYLFTGTFAGLVGPKVGIFTPDAMRAPAPAEESR